MSCALVHPEGIPASGGAVSAHGISASGLKPMGAPRRLVSLMIIPFASRGEWQSAHMPTCSTR